MNIRLFSTLVALAVSGAGPILADLRVSSQSVGLEFATINTLPAAPDDQEDTRFCDHLFQAVPETTAGQAVHAQGWHITAELPFGDLTAVSFIGRAIPATSGTCELLDGNVGLFSDNQLVALVFGANGSKPMIGEVRPFGKDGLRVWSGDVLPTPVADLQRTDFDHISVMPLAKEELFCGGAAVVPHIYDLPINEARAPLLQMGWTPVPGDQDAYAYSQAKDIAAAGVPEVEECAGTGFGFCAYRYSGPAGMLSVTTAGEIGEDGTLPMVVSYEVTCN